jgi:hypothetical protein
MRLNCADRKELKAIWQRKSSNRAESTSVPELD